MKIYITTTVYITIIFALQWSYLHVRTLIPDHVIIPFQPRVRKKQRETRGKHFQKCLPDLAV